LQLQIVGKGAGFYVNTCTPLPSSVPIRRSHSTAHENALTASEMAERMGTDEGKGVQVVDVKPGSFADDLQLQPGMVYLKINKQPVNSEEEFRKIMSQLRAARM